MSGRKNVLLPKHILVDGDMSLDAESSVIDGTYQDNIGLQIEWTGSPTGTISIQASIDYDARFNTGTFYELSFSPALGQPAGAADGYLVNLNQLPFPFYKVSYDAAGGTGVLNVWVTSKEV